MTNASTPTHPGGGLAEVRPSNRATLVAILFVAVLAAAVYIEAIGHEFQNWDDPTLLLERSRVHALTFSNIKSIWTEPHEGDYFPLTETLYAVEYALQADRPALYHGTNLILHAGCAALVCIFALRLGLTIEGMLVSGLLFAVHPVHVETVAWVAEHKDLLAALFSLLAMIAVTDLRNRRRSYVWATVWGLAAILSKPSAVSIGLVLFVIDVWHKKSKPRIALLRVMPLLVAGVVLTLLVVHMHQSGGNVTGTFWENPSRAILLAGYGTSFYLWKFINPNPLIPLYAYPDPVGWGVPAFVGALLVSVLLIVLLIRYRHAKWLPLTIGLYLAAVLPVLRFVEVGRMVVADRYAYFPSVALCVGVGAIWMWGRSRVSSSSRWTRYRCVGGLVLAILAILTIMQNRVWRNPETLWRYTVTLNPKSPTAHLNLGDAFYHTDRYEEAEAQFRVVLRLDPDNAKAMSNLGHAISAQGKAAEAIDAYTKTLQRFPDRPRIHYFLAGILASQNRGPEAEQHYRRAIDLDPNYVEALAAYSKWLRDERRSEQAADYLRRAAQIDPDHPAVLRATGDGPGPRNDPPPGDRAPKPQNP